jgi:hypothetical protein
MKCFVFLGPTLSHEAARADLDATYLPPVAQGDVLRAARERPFAIGIVDGYFERLPAVWHKEILWAISQGIHVFGAASMGALRAAELHPFGMRGVGTIFDAYRSGTLEDDDEVAVAHGDAASGFRAISEAMVNVRATLRQAVRARVAPGAAIERVEAIAKRLFYPERSYAHVFARALEEGVDAGAVEALRAFVASHRVDQKRDDARALLKDLRVCMNEGRPAAPATFHFAHTEAWDQVLDWSETQPPLGPTSDGVGTELLTSEVRLLGARGRAILADALNRLVAGVLARRAGVKQGELDWLRARYRDDLDRHVADAARSTGDYTALVERARRKQDLLARRGLENATLAEAGVGERELMAWYFEQRLGAPVPADVDGYITETGLADRRALEREALRELLYTRRSEDGT